MTRRKMASTGAFVACLVAGMLLAAAGEPSKTQELSAGQIAEALKPMKTRTWGKEAKARRERIGAFVEAVRRKMKARGLGRDDRQDIARVLAEETLPSIDLTVPFDLDSALITPTAAGILDRLTGALKDPSLARSTFLVAGHTDATGPDDYNQALSERRAQAVRDYLADKGGIPARSLIAIGFGEEQPKPGIAPSSGENRRVQIVNLAR